MLPNQEPPEVLAIGEGAEPSTSAGQNAAAQITSNWGNNTSGSTDRPRRPMSDASRSHSKWVDREREQEMHDAHAKDMAEIDRHRATDTRAGVPVHLGRGHDSTLPEPTRPRAVTATSVVGRGSTQFHTGERIQLLFEDTLESSRYALMAQCGGEAMDSEFGQILSANI